MAPPGEAPPLLVKIHGGPTSQAGTAFSLAIQYWTSRGERAECARGCAEMCARQAGQASAGACLLRSSALRLPPSKRAKGMRRPPSLLCLRIGFAVADVNYGGSTGYGRAYRKRCAAGATGACRPTVACRRLLLALSCAPPDSTPHDAPATPRRAVLQAGGHVGRVGRRRLLLRRAPPGGARAGRPRSSLHHRRVGGRIHHACGAVLQVGRAGSRGATPPAVHRAASRLRHGRVGSA